MKTEPIKYAHAYELFTTNSKEPRLRPMKMKFLTLTFLERFRYLVYF
jgi:hypothetical protein